MGVELDGAVSVRGEGPLGGQLLQQVGEDVILLGRPLNLPCNGKVRNAVLYVHTQLLTHGSMCHADYKSCKQQTWSGSLERKVSLMC